MGKTPYTLPHPPDKKISQMAETVDIWVKI